MIIDSDISSTGLPPYFSGIVMPCKPYSQNFCHSSRGGLAALSLSKQVGANTSSAKLRTISRIILCSSVSLNSIISPDHAKRMVLLMSRNEKCNNFLNRTIQNGCQSGAGRELVWRIAIMSNLV